MGCVRVKLLEFLRLGGGRGLMLYFGGSLSGQSGEWVEMGLADGLRGFGRARVTKFERVEKRHPFWIQCSLAEGILLVHFLLYFTPTRLLPRGFHAAM